MPTRVEKINCIDAYDNFSYKILCPNIEMHHLFKQLVGSPECALMLQTRDPAYDVILQQGEGRGRLILDYLNREDVSRADGQYESRAPVLIVDRLVNLRRFHDRRAGGEEMQHQYEWEQSERAESDVEDELPIGTAC